MPLEELQMPVDVRANRQALLYSYAEREQALPEASLVGYGR